MQKTTMSKKLLVLTLALAMLLSLSVFTVNAADEYEFWDLRNSDNITVSTLNGQINGEPATITRYTGYYAASSNSTQQQINIYVPSNAGPYSGIMQLVDNSGWQSNNFPTNTVANNFNYSLSTNSATGQAVARGMIVVSQGARSRNNGATAGSYLGHSPATMTDTKAALRFVRYNCEPGRLLDGLCNPDMAFVTGTSGGGALSVILAACGNSPDYFESLYEIGAAGVESFGNSYYSTISDAYIGTIAYCPISDLPMADQAYEFTYNVSRTMRASNGNVNGSLAAYENNNVMQASAFLANDYADYINGLGLKDEYGNTLNASYIWPDALDGVTGNRALAGTPGGTFLDAMQRLLERGINKAINEYQTGYNSRSNADSISNLDTRSAYITKSDGTAFDAGIPAFGDIAVISDFNQFLTSLPNSVLKIAPAFDNQGLVHAGSQNENNLVGTRAQQYSHWEEWAWNDANTSIAGVGLTNTGLTWDEFLQTDDGALVALQSKMTTPIPYLLGAANIPYLKYTPGSDYADVAPYWYVRHGQADRDTSFAIGTLLNYSLLANSQVDQDLLNFNFAWAKAHQGNYDILEAFDWIDAVLADAAEKVTNIDLDAYVTKLSGNQNLLTISITVDFYNAKSITYEEAFSINNNAAGFYEVGPYSVYVDTKGNDQIRSLYIAA